MAGRELWTKCLDVVSIKRERIYYNLTNLVSNSSFNLGGLFNWAVTEDDRNSSKHVIVVSTMTVYHHV